jgi:hypothetical protein
MHGDSKMHLPPDNVYTWPHRPFEQLHGGGLANAAGATDKDGDKVLDAVAFSIAGTDGFGRNHLQRLSGEEQRRQCIDRRTVVTTQSNAESGTARQVVFNVAGQWAREGTRRVPLVCLKRRCDDRRPRIE